MRASVKTDLKKLEKYLNKQEKALVKALSDTVTAAARLIQGEAKRSIQRGQRSGHTYMVVTDSKGRRVLRPLPKNRAAGAKLHQSSAPGEPPKTLTGGLANSIAIEKPDYFTAEIGSALKYSVLEKDRPYLKAALEKNKEKIQSAYDRIIQKALEQK